MYYSLNSLRRYKRRITRICLFVVFVLSTLIWLFFALKNKKDYINSQLEIDYFTLITPLFFFSIAIASFLFFMLLGFKEKKEKINSYGRSERKKYYYAIVVTFAVLLIKEFVMWFYDKFDQFDFHALLWGVFGISCFNFLYTIIRIVRN